MGKTRDAHEAAAPTHAAAAAAARRKGLPYGNFLKTRMCKFLATGSCSFGTKCAFAHSEEELEERPNLSKTSLCASFMEGHCPRRARECPFAHGRAELRVVPPRGAGAGGPGPGAPAACRAAVAPPPGQRRGDGLAEGRGRSLCGNAHPAPGEGGPEKAPPRGLRGRAEQAPAAVVPPPPPPQVRQPNTGGAPSAQARGALGLVEPPGAAPRGGPRAAGGRDDGEQPLGGGAAGGWAAGTWPGPAAPAAAPTEARPSALGARDRPGRGVGAEAVSPCWLVAAAPGTCPVVSPAAGAFVCVLIDCSWQGQPAFVWQNRVYPGSAEDALRQAEPSHYEE